MNERIKELILEAGTDISGKWMGLDQAEKFAELIVEECAKQAYREELTVEEGMMRYRRILEHFGVEE